MSNDAEAPAARQGPGGTHAPKCEAPLKPGKLVTHHCTLALPCKHRATHTNPSTNFVLFEPVSHCVVPLRCGRQERWRDVNLLRRRSAVRSMDDDGKVLKGAAERERERLAKQVMCMCACVCVSACMHTKDRLRRSPVPPRPRRSYWTACNSRSSSGLCICRSASSN